MHSRGHEKESFDSLRVSPLLFHSASPDQMVKKTLGTFNVARLHKNCDQTGENAVTFFSFWQLARKVATTAATTASISSILAAPLIEIGSRRSNHHSQGIGLRVL